MYIHICMYVTIKICIGLFYRQVKIYIYIYIESLYWEIFTEIELKEYRYGYAASEPVKASGLSLAWSHIHVTSACRCRIRWKASSIFFQLTGSFFVRMCGMMLIWGKSSCTWCPKETNGPLTSIVLFPWSPWNNLIFSLWPEVGCRMSRGVWWGPRLFQEANSLWYIYIYILVPTFFKHPGFGSQSWYHDVGKVRSFTHGLAQSHFCAVLFLGRGSLKSFNRVEKKGFVRRGFETISAYATAISS